MEKALEKKLENEIEKTKKYFGIKKERRRRRRRRVKAWNLLETIIGIGRCYAYK